MRHSYNKKETIPSTLHLMKRSNKITGMPSTGLPSTSTPHTQEGLCHSLQDSHLRDLAEALHGKVATHLETLQRAWIRFQAQLPLAAVSLHLQSFFQDVSFWEIRTRYRDLVCFLISTLMCISSFCHCSLPEPPLALQAHSKVTLVEVPISAHPLAVASSHCFWMLASTQLFIHFIITRF